MNAARFNLVVELAKRIKHVSRITHYSRVSLAFGNGRPVSTDDLDFTPTEFWRLNDGRQFGDLRIAFWETRNEANLAAITFAESCKKAGLPNPDIFIIDIVGDQIEVLDPKPEWYWHANEAPSVVQP